MSFWKNFSKLIIAGTMFGLLGFTLTTALPDSVGANKGLSTSKPHKGKVTNTFYNPIMDQGADPWMIRHQGAYYFTKTTGNNVTIWQSKGITDIATGEKKVVWSSSGTQFRDIWAPELHYFKGHWYVYFAADLNGDNATHRMYVLKSENANPFSTYNFKGKISTPSDEWAIDGTVLKLNGKMYFVWSGWEADSPGFPQNLYIAPMSNPWTISGERARISSPDYPWEKSVAPINEGPEVLKHDGKTYIVYSANASWTNEYCLGMLSFKGHNPLTPSNWVKSPSPVFRSNGNVFGPGHASFTTSKNGKQNWIIYHAARYSEAGWDRNIRSQPFTWNPDGTPRFGQPVSTEQQLPLPDAEVPSRVTYQPVSSSDRHTTFSVRAPKTGLYTMYVRYGNGSGEKTAQNVSVNGRPRSTISFPRTGDEDQWSTLIKKINLNHGENTVRFDVEKDATRVKFIQISRHGDKEFPDDQSIYEAENNIYHNAQVVNESEASDGKVVGHIDYSDSYVKFNNVYVPSDGMYAITVRYDNGLGNAVDHVSINGGSSFELRLPSTSYWNMFQTVTFQVDLHAGLNAIQLIHDMNYAQIDYIKVSESPNRES